MSVTRLIPVPALVIDLVMVAQVMAAGAPEKTAGVYAMRAAKSHEAAGAVYTMSLIDAPRDAVGAWYLILAGDERSTQDGVPGSLNSRVESKELKTTTNEKSAAIPPATQAPATGKRAASSQLSESPPSRKPNASTSKSQEEMTPAEKSPSILQMLEGHGTELTVGVAIALAVFFIGWICGGNYYLRRDRRRRTKLRF